MEPNPFPRLERPLDSGEQRHIGSEHPCRNPGCILHQHGPPRHVGQIDAGERDGGPMARSNGGALGAVTLKPAGAHRSVEGKEAQVRLGIHTSAPDRPRHDGSGSLHGERAVDGHAKEVVAGALGNEEYALAKYGA